MVYQDLEVEGPPEELKQVHAPPLSTTPFKYIAFILLGAVVFSVLFVASYNQALNNKPNPTQPKAFDENNKFWADASSTQRNSNGPIIPTKTGAPLGAHHLSCAEKTQICGYVSEDFHQFEYRDCCDDQDHVCHAQTLPL